MLNTSSYLPPPNDNKKEDLRLVVCEDAGLGKHCVESLSPSRCSL